MDKFDDLITAAVRAARATFARLGMCPSLWLLQSETELGIIEAQMYKDVDHDIVDRRMREIIKEKNIDRFVYISEVWTLSSDDPAVRSIEDHPDRTESILITAEEHKTKRRECYIIPILSNPRRLATNRYRRDKAPEGRFTNMWDPPPPPRPDEPLDMVEPLDHGSVH